MKKLHAPTPEERLIQHLETYSIGHPSLAPAIANVILFLSDSTRKRIGDVTKIGAHLKAARKKAGFSQVKLQEESGVDQSSISRIERGEVPGVSLQIWRKLQKALPDLANL